MKLGFRELVFLMLMGALVAGSYFFVFKPASQKRDERVADIAGKKKKLADLKMATADISNIEKKIQELEQAIKFFEDKLPQQRELEVVLQEIAKRADKNGLNTKAIKTKNFERAAGYAEQPIEINLAGDFRSFYNFMLELEKLDRITQLKTMKLDKMLERDGAMQAQMMLSVFFEAGAKTE